MVTKIALAIEECVFFRTVINMGLGALNKLVKARIIKPRHYVYKIRDGLAIWSKGAGEFRKTLVANP